MKTTWQWVETLCWRSLQTRISVELDLYRNELGRLAPPCTRELAEARALADAANRPPRGFPANLRPEIRNPRNAMKTTDFSDRPGASRPCSRHLCQDKQQHQAEEDAWPCFLISESPYLP